MKIVTHKDFIKTESTFIMFIQFFGKTWLDFGIYWVGREFKLFFGPIFYHTYFKK